MSADLWSLSDLCTPWCVHVVATLRIAEFISEGKSEIGELAEAARCDRYALHAMLGHLVSKGVFEEPEFGRFALNDAARQFLDPGARLGLNLDGLGGRMAHAWGTMLTYVRTGRSGYAEIFGRPFFDDLDANAEIGAEFDALIGPAGHGTPRGDFELSDGWADVRHVVDVGGGTGAMLAEILRLHPGVRGTLVDRPQTVSRSGAILDKFRDRVTISGQSFFDLLPAGADVYVLRGILNDWPDAEAVAILRRCAEAAGEKGRVVILGGVREGRMGLVIEMILLGGKHRSVDEMRALAREAGLDVLSAGRQASGYFVTECRRA